MNTLEGVFLPIVTPFIDNKVDFKSYEKLINHYISKGISGLIPLGTTGENSTISNYEYEEILESTIEYTKGRVPIYVGAGGNCTDKVIKLIKSIEKYQISGILSVCPYYNRPDQRGIYQHFLKISESTSLDIIIYNIPYRTGVNIENETIYKLSEINNIIGIKDSCGNIKQTMDLLVNKPKNFSVLTGEDILFYPALALGANGGILASAHVYTNDFIDLYNLIRANKYNDALKIWNKLYNIIPLLFKESNPSPIKYCLKKMNLIFSDETRLPIVQISNDLAKLLDNTFNF